MGKLIFWLVVIFGLLLVLRLVNTAAARRRTRDAGAPKDAPADTMVRCASCGVYLPRADALPAPDGWRCGDPACAPRR